MAEEYENYDTMTEKARGLVDNLEPESGGNGQTAEDIAHLQTSVTEGVQTLLRRLDSIEEDVHGLHDRLTHESTRAPTPEPDLAAQHVAIRDKDELDIEAAWGLQAAREPRWPASLAVLGAIVLYTLLPDKLIFSYTRWIVPALEVALLLPLSVIAPHRHIEESQWRRMASIALIAIINLANIASLALLVGNLIGGHAKASGTDLIFAAADIWLTNAIVFALWYWELDRGGPGARCAESHRAPDFLFPQMSTPEAAPPGWVPRFVDYLYVSFTNAEAFSPTDTMPLTQWAKLLMTVQSVASLITIALVAARAVNILA
jgi:uncharacterized membrane protein